MVIVASEEDRRALQAEGVKTPLLLIPIIVPLRERPRMMRAAEVLFVGGFNHAPNVDGILWFVKECWDAVRRAVPDARLSVVGSNPTREVMELAGASGVEVHGYVADTAPYLDRAAVSIAPLRYGAGMKGKVCEALASGVPLVTTSVGAQGIPLVSGISARIADMPREFSDAVVWALQSPAGADAMGDQGRDVISRICSVPAVLPQVGALVDFLKRRPQPSLVALLKWWCEAACFRVRWVSRRCVALFGGRWLRRWWRSRRPTGTT
jgi:glycosyltransferase involved in cell wall biosynthesis